MNVEIHNDIVTVATPADGKPASPPETEQPRSLGGEILTSQAAVRLPVGNASSLVPLTLVDDSTPGKSAVPADSGAGIKPPTAQERQQAVYDQKHGQFEKDLAKYWDGVAAAGKGSHFVMEFPPIYNGPPNPRPPVKHPETPNSVPTILNMLDDSKHLNQFASGDKNLPEFHLRQVGEKEFKDRYAEEALDIGKKYNLSKDAVRDIVRSIYAFEDGGWGTHETLSGMPPSIVSDDKPAGTTSQTARLDFHLKGPGASSALGYNQMLTATTMKTIQEEAQPIATRLNQLALDHPDQAVSLHEKAKLVTTLSGALDRELKTMAAENSEKKPADQAADQKDYLDQDGKPTDLLYRAFLNSSEPTEGGMTRQDMARAVQALNLDGDIGPIIQAQCLGDLLKSADKYQYQALLQGQEQDYKVATGKYDALPTSDKQQAVQDIVDRIKPPATAGDGTAARHDFDVTKAGLTDRLLAMGPGADGKLSKENLSQAESDMLRTQVLTLKDFGEASGALPPRSQLLLKKVAESYYDDFSADHMMPAAIELANLAGPVEAQKMLDAKNQDVPTPNFFSRAGYYANPVTNGRTGSELLLQIERIMNGPSFGKAVRTAQADFDQAFDQAAQH